MRPEDRDAAFLWDLADVARTAVHLLEGYDLQTYLKDRKTQLALERSLEIIGEAARQISHEFKRLHPEVPWSAVIGQRNVLAHEYGDIKQDRLWQVAVRRLPELIRIVEGLLPAGVDPTDENPEKK